MSAMTIVGTLRPVLAFAMIASESDKCLGCFRDNMDMFPCTTSMKARSNRRKDGFITIRVTLVGQNVEHQKGIASSTQDTSCLVSCKMMLKIQNVAFKRNDSNDRDTGRR